MVVGLITLLAAILVVLTVVVGYALYRVSQLRNDIDLLSAQEQRRHRELFEFFGNPEANVTLMATLWAHRDEVLAALMRIESSNGELMSKLVATVPSAARTAARAARSADGEG